jgi:CRP-like cAMP-binding protein
MSAGQVIIRQGDVADHYYIVVEGEVDVTMAEGTSTRHLRTMTVAQGFGEIGLLGGVPRTATVTARTDGTLLELDRDDFLELVTGGSGLTFPLLDAHRALGVDTT